MSQETLHIVNLPDNLSMSEELQLLEDLFNKYGLKTISEYSDETRINRQTLYNHINSGKIASIKLGKQTFIVK